MKNKLSYIIASNKESCALDNAIKSVLDLNDSDFEIIVCSENKPKENPYIKWIKDDRNTGSVYAFNEAYKASQNDYIIILPDDFYVKHDFLRIKEYFASDDFQSLNFKIFNLTHHLGGPEKIYYDKIRKAHTGMQWGVANPLGHTKNARPYNIWHVFGVERASVEKYMENVIFNTCFMHHYVDHWVGFYEEMINGNRPSEKLGPDIYLDCNGPLDAEKKNVKFDFDDQRVFYKLVSLSDSPNISYNFQV